MEVTPTNTRKPLSWWQRKWLVEEHFQLRFVGFAAITAVISCAVFYGVSTYFFAHYTGFAIESGLRPSHPFFTVLFNMENLMSYIFAFTSIGVILFSITAGLMFSNKVAGPMSRLREHCEKVAKGETLEDVRFREDDYFHDVADAYNRQLTALRARIETLEKKAAENGTPFKKAG